jgi:SAM-dependent methyltransferase
VVDRNADIQSAYDESANSESRLTEDFYNSSLVIRTYDVLTEQANQQISADIAFYLEYAGRFGGPVLELGVGTGRVAVALTEAGYDVVGIDRSEGMLEAARNKGSRLGPAVSERLRLTVSDITSFKLDERFSLALVPFSTFQHLATSAQQRSCLKAIHRHLVGDARLIIDCFDPILDACVPGAATPNPDREAVDPETGHKYYRRSVARSNDPLSQTVVETFRFEVVDQSEATVESEEVTHTLRWATRQEMMYLFELSGFEIDEEYSDFRGGEPTYGNRQIWVVKPV